MKSVEIPGRITDLDPDDRAAAEHVLSDPALTGAVLREIFAHPDYADKGRLPLDVFKAFAEHTTLPTLELVPLRVNPQTGRTQVLLYERDESDPWWPGQLHAPGVMILHHEVGRQLPFHRILGEEGELRGGVKLEKGSTPVFVGFEDRTAEDTGRGPEIARIYYAAVVADEESAEPAVGRFYDIDDIRSGEPLEGRPLIHHHRQMILDAAELFDRNRPQDQKIAVARQVGSRALQ